jgi:hypothetical protein
MSGAAGVLALNGIHEAGKKTLTYAPQVNAIGTRVMGQSLERAGMAPFSLSTLKKVTFAADLVSGALYYGLTVAGVKKAKSNRSYWLRAVFFGSAVGIGVATLPPVLGWGYQPTRRPAITAALTVTWYLSGALVAAAVASLLDRKTS